MSILDIKTEEELDIAIVTNTGEEKLVVDFYKDNCGACRMLATTIAELEPKFEESNVKFVKMKLEDVGEELFHKMNVQGTPTLIMFKEGKIVGKPLVGMQPPDVTAEFLGVK